MAQGRFSAGVGYFSEGFGMIRQPGLRRYVVIPIILNILAFVLLFRLIYDGFSMLIAQVMSWLPDWAWLQSIQWLFWLLYGVVIILLLAYGFVVVANLIGAPFYALLAEKAEQRLTGRPLEEDRSWWQLWLDVPRSLWREIVKLGYYLPRAVVLLLLGLIPVVNLAAGVLWFLFNSWMMALQYVDYPADNHRMPVRELKGLLRQRRWASFGFGMPVALAAMIPVLNLVVVPAAVCGATLFWVREREGHVVESSPGPR